MSAASSVTAQERKDAALMVAAVRECGGLPLTNDISRWKELYAYLYAYGIHKEVCDEIYQNGLETTRQVIPRFYLRLGGYTHSMRRRKPNQATTELHQAGLIKEAVAAWKAKSGGYLPSKENEEGWKAFGKLLEEWRVPSSLISSILIGGWHGSLETLNSWLAKVKAGPETPTQSQASLRASVKKIAEMIGFDMSTWNSEDDGDEVDPCDLEDMDE